MAQGARAGETLVGKYRLDGLLGTGGMGEVYRAENTLIGRAVAIKVMKNELIIFQELVARFLREARAANIVRHPNVVDVLDIGQTEDGAPFIVQELLEGEDLSAYVEGRGGRLKASEAIELLLPVIDAVSYAHERGVIHRDLKPENVFLARSGAGVVPKLLDFGISRIASPDEQKMTATGMSLGTPAYMSPEQIKLDRPVDSRTDVWSFGIILHELVAGELPFVGDAPSSLFVKIATESPVALDVAMPGAPKELAAIVAKCLKRSPDDRFATAADLARELRSVTSRGALDTAVHAPTAASSPPKPSQQERALAPTSFVNRAPPSAAVPDLDIRKPNPKPAISVRAAPVVAPSSDSLDLDDIVPVASMRNEIAHHQAAPTSMRVARANLGMRESLETRETDGGRGVIAVAVMWGLTLAITALLVTYVPIWRDGWPVVELAQRLDSAPTIISASIVVGCIVAGFTSAALGWRSDPLSWGFIIVALGLILDALLTLGFFIRTLPSLTGTGTMDALARLIFPWSTVFVALGLAVLALRRAWTFWSVGAPGERFGGTIFHVILAAVALYGAAQVVRGGGGRLPGTDDEPAMRVPSEPAARA